MLSRPEIRRRTREQLGGNIFASTWLYMLLVYLIVGAILSAVSFTFIGTLILAGPLAWGVAKIELALVRGKKDVNLGDLFAGFSEDFTNSFLLGLMQEIFIILWTLLFIIPGIVKSYSYAMAFYIQQDSPNKDWNYCITESRRMMDGHKMQLFLLDLSFLGWMIVGILCCGVGTLWVQPYMSVSRANFYLELKGESAPAADEVTL